MNALATLEIAAPAEALLLDAGALGFRTDKTGVTGTMTLAEGVATGDQRHGFLIIHRHTGEGFADITRRCHRVRLTVRAFRIDIDKPHLHGGKRILKLAVAGIPLVTKPGVLGTPVDVLLRLPHILAATGESEGLEAHRFQRAVASEDHQVGP